MVWPALLLLALPARAQDPLLVNTADGPVRGGWRPAQNGSRYKSFQGIPFAAPPVGALRFRAPEPAPAWQGELDASQDSEVQCTQYGFMSDGPAEVSGSEDCLYLSVYVPEGREGEQLPVMMWIFGGYFQAGGNQWWAYGAAPWLQRDVIIVQPNHRLGPFGFTSLGIEEAPGKAWILFYSVFTSVELVYQGNQGLRDLVAALKWIKVNIAEFGGNPDQVTIFGESSGSWAVSYLCLSPHAAGLFHRAILQGADLRL